MGILSCLLSVAAIPLEASASVSDNQVRSQHIAEADGTSGQNPNSGSGVKTLHIQDGAVTGAKILDATIGAADLGSNAVTNAKIADGAVTITKLAPDVEARIASLEASVANLLARLAVVEANPVLPLGSYVRLETGDLNGATGPNVVFDGVNVHVLNGVGINDGYYYGNGTGNLILGYNELRPGGPNTRIGSHNLVTGTANNYISNGGIVAGVQNTLDGRYVTVLGGYGNYAGGFYTAVSGGAHNVTGGDSSSISGGYANTATGNYSSISGGSGNTVTQEGQWAP